MDLTFEKIFRKVIELEGGFKLHKNPTEELETYAGIYRKAHPEWEGWKYLDKGEIPPTNLVRLFYYDNYWKPLDYKELSNKSKCFLFDCAINTGIKPTVKLFQKVIDVVPDGIIGPKTLLALKTYNQEKLFNELFIARVIFYVTLANKNPAKYGLYLRGWLNRIIDVFNFIETEIK